MAKALIKYVNGKSKLRPVPHCFSNNHLGIERMVPLLALEVMVVIVIPVVPHKAVAEVSRIGNLQERLVVVIHG